MKLITVAPGFSKSDIQKPSSPSFKEKPACTYHPSLKAV